jgi:hypothetical protein
MQSKKKEIRLRYLCVVNSHVDSKKEGHCQKVELFMGTKLDNVADTLLPATPHKPESHLQCGNGAQYWCGTKVGEWWHDAPETRTWSQGPSPLSPEFDQLRNEAIAKGGTGYLMIATGWDPITGRYINKDGVCSLGF